MSDVTSTTTTAPAETTSSPTPILANDPASRTPQGEIKDQSQPASGTEPQVLEAAKTEGPGVPEAYTFKAPEGIKLDDKALAEVTPLFKEMKLSQDSAQKLVDFYAKAQVSEAKRAAEAVTSMRTEWRDAVMKDSELGPKLETIKADIGKAITVASAGDPKLVADFKAAMDLTGAGDNPAIIKMINRLSAAVNEGTHVTGSGPSEHGQVANGRASRPSAAESLYPNLVQNRR
jgi:hypothetical protein